MFRPVLAAGLLLLACQAQAEAEPKSRISFDFKKAPLLSSLFKLPEPVEPVPEPLYAKPLHMEDSRPTVYASEEEEERALREQLFEALGAAHLVPRGQFRAAGLLTRWHFSAPDEDTVQLSFSARW